MNNFDAVNGNIGGRGNAEPDPISVDFKHGHTNIVSDHNFLLQFTGQNEHDFLPWTFKLGLK